MKSVAVSPRDADVLELSKHNVDRRCAPVLERRVQRRGHRGQPVSLCVFQPPLGTGVRASEVQQQLPGGGGQIQAEIVEGTLGGVLAGQGSKPAAEPPGVVEDRDVGGVGEQIAQPAIRAGLVTVNVDRSHPELFGGRAHR